MLKKHTPLAQSREVVKKMAETIVSMFKEFKVPVEVVEAVDGFSSYHFYLQPKKPMRMKAFASFVEDLRYELSNDGVEIQAPVPNKKLVGITVPKKEDLPAIPFSDALKWEEFRESGPLVVPLGIDEFGNRHLMNIARMPHILAAGTTGSGKSVLLHSLINALIEKNTPEQVRFMFIDPKLVELTLYDGLPHSLTKPVTQAKKAVQALSWAVKEMERRYDILEAEGVMNISVYHKDVYQPAKESWEKAGAKEADRAELPEALPFILIIVDELNDIMQTYPAEFEACVVRLAQMSRAVGIHLILTTQRPSTSVITGSIKANIPARIAMMVACQVDSRTILDVGGAEKLRGEGDMLLQSPEDFRPQRIQGLYISEDEIIDRVKVWKKYDEGELDTLDFDHYNGNDAIFNAMVGGDGEEDDLYEDAKAAVIKAGKASTSYIQRSLRIGYSRAARLLDLLEDSGVIGPQDGSKPRNVLVDPE
ncbi:MAG: DNA translocase FtsK [Candidatus Nomurabacteria bacterium]|nr:MAG: DNA translocase FtsK [Candidatus Nomurabacteria bacterium]